MKTVRNIAIVTTLILASCGRATNSHVNALSQPRGMDACVAVQSHLQSNYTGWNSIGLTQDPGGRCKVAVTYASAQEFQKYLQTSAARNESPLRLNASNVAVNVSHEVIGQIVAQPESESGIEKFPATFLTTSEMDLCLQVKADFERSVGSDAFRRIDLNTVGIGGRPLNQCTLFVGFASGAGYRKFVAERIAKGLNPTAHEVELQTSTGPRLVKMFIDAEEFAVVIR